MFWRRSEQEQEQERERDWERRARPALWRHGDVLIARSPYETLPVEARRRQTPVLVWGELTGHSHRLADAGSAELWEAEGTLYLRVTAPSATIVHEEHHPITLPGGLYRVWTQREYTPREIRRVVD
jgi:hypothetical protein